MFRMLTSTSFRLLCLAFMGVSVILFTDPNEWLASQGTITKTAIGVAWLVSYTMLLQTIWDARDLRFYFDAFNKPFRCMLERQGATLKRQIKSNDDQSDDSGRFDNN